MASFNSGNRTDGRQQRKIGVGVCVCVGVGVGVGVCGCVCVRWPGIKVGRCVCVCGGLCVFVMARNKERQVCVSVCDGQE